MYTQQYIAGFALILTVEGTVIAPVDLHTHHSHPLHTPATANINVNSVVVSSSTSATVITAGDVFRGQFATTLEALVDEVRPLIHAERTRVVTWPTR